MRIWSISMPSSRWITPTQPIAQSTESHLPRNCSATIRVCARVARTSAQSLRVFTQRPYLLVYQTIPDTDDEPVDSVIIIRVIDGRRDLQHLL